MSAHAEGGPRSAPHRHDCKFSSARVCKVTFKHLPQPLRTHIQSYGTLRQLLNVLLKLKKRPQGTRWEVPDFLWVNISFFVGINPM